MISKNPSRGREILGECLFRHDLQLEIKRLRDEYSIDQKSICGSDDQSRAKWMTIFCNSDLEGDLKIVLQNLAIPEDYFWHIHRFVIDDHIGSTETLDDDEQGVVVEYDENDVNNVVFKVGPTATRKEVVEAWEKVLELREREAPRRKNKSTLVRDQEIFIWVRHGATLNQVFKMVQQRFGEEIDFGSIKNIASEYYKKYKIPLKDRPKLVTEKIPLKLN